MNTHQGPIAARLSASVILLCAMVGLPALAQDSSFEEAVAPGNWMAEFVALRTQAMSRRAAAARGRAEPNFPIDIKIVGGVPATPTDNPFQVALVAQSIADNFNAQYCGGTLIKPNVVVTAAHCSDFISAGQVQVLTGARKLDGSGTRRNVTRIAIHPKWNPTTFDYDVAVWTIAGNTGGPFATLASSDSTPLLATGWGTLTAGGSRPRDLMKVTLPLVDRGNCNDANSYNGAITDRMLCAGRDAGGVDTCQGDSGGPLTKGSGSSELTGITSWGRGCALANYYGVYTRISNAAIRSFIEAND